jgi:hypothetical protein
VFYSDKSQWVSKSLTQSEYSRAGFKCIPLQGIDLHGLKGTMMTYDDCLDTVEPVNDINVVKQDNDYVYKWTTGGVASYASSTAETVSNPTWQKDGYVCRPAKKDQIFDSTMNYEECKIKARPPDDTNSVVIYEGVGEFQGRTIMEYRPFSDINVALNARNMEEVLKLSSQDGDSCSPGSSSMCDCCTGFSVEEPFSAAEFAIVSDANIVSTVVAKFMTCVDDGKCVSACDYFKSNSLGPFECTKPTSNDALPTTHDEAVAYYKNNYAPDALCAPTKENAPFQCTGSEPKSAVEILSLSFSNTELAFSVFGTLFVFILYKCKKAKDPDFLQEKELLAILEKLEADNADMKKAMEATNEAIKRLEAGKA